MNVTGIKRSIGRQRLFDIMRRHITATVWFSVAINILFLVSPIYMLQVYDRVLTTGSVPTLLLLTLIAVFLLGIYLFAEAGRRRVMARAAEALGDELAEEGLERGFSDPRVTPAQTLTAIKNLGQVQSLLNQGLAASLVDLPFVPFFLAILFVVHPVLGMVGLFGALGLVALALLTERTTKVSMRESSNAERMAQDELNQLVRQRGAVVGMGMSERAIGRWSKLRVAANEASLRAGVPATLFGASTRALRMTLQIAILGAGAFLAVRGFTSPGAIIAGSIIMGRALAPIDQVVNGWRQLVKGGRAFNELGAWVLDKPERTAATPLPRPNPQISFDGVAVGIPGADRPLLPPLKHAFPKGQIVALLGQSGSGKTSLLQTLAASWSPVAGSVRLGGADMHRWHGADRGRYVGYLPQDVELLRGTVRENISRFSDAPAEEVFEAAQRAGCHQLILSLPDSYDTLIGEGGTVLSAGQRQAIGLARAFFGNPALLILDEPTAHLDAAMTAHILHTFAKLASIPAEDRRTTIFVSTHDLRLVNVADDVLVIRDRKVTITRRDAYLQQVSELQRQKAGAQARLAQPAEGVS
ncbi:MAG: ATP-binding cassette domain-containing protein [Parvularcula sp.]|jgi:PrtD family type I secretion system ABC transporter|nr:ATP-binding cassette domain-containing protein [Parvularcula sp.]